MASSLRILAHAVLTAGAFLGMGPAAATPFDSILVFGDSNSDAGRRFALEGHPVSPPYYMGRHSNGPVAVEYVASALGATLTPGLNNFAVGGAFTGSGNIDTTHNDVLASTGMLDQFQTFKALVGATADPNALYFIWGGGNDITQCGGNACSAAQLGAAVNNLSALVADLFGLGARHFFVPGLYGGSTADQAFNALLVNAVAALDSKGEDVRYFNSRAVLLTMLSPGNPYGFTNFSSSTPCYTGDLAGNGGTLCDNPDQYVFWDTEGHLTAPANRILGDAMAATLVPEPCAAALVPPGLVLVLLAALRQRRILAQQRQTA